MRDERHRRRPRFVASNDALGCHELDPLDIGRSEGMHLNLDRTIDLDLAAHREPSHLDIEQDLGTAGGVAAPRPNRLEDRLSGTRDRKHGRQSRAERITLAALAVVPQQAVAVGVRDEPKPKSAVEQWFYELVAKIATVSERVVRVLVAPVAGTDFPNRLPDRVVPVDIGSGPADVMGSGKRALLGDSSDDLGALRHIIARDDRSAGPRKVDTLVSRARIGLSRPLVGDDGGELARLIVLFGDRLQIRPFTGPDALSEKRLVVGERREVVSVAMPAAKVRLVGRANAVGMGAVLLDVTEEDRRSGPCGVPALAGPAPGVDLSWDELGRAPPRPIE